MLTYAKNDADWSQRVTNKSDYCILCNGPGVTPAHIISRRHVKTRLIIENGVPLCVRCHNWFDALSVDLRERASIFMIGDVYSELIKLVEERRPAKKWV